MSGKTTLKLRSGKIDAVDLSGADVREGDFSQATMLGACFRGADLRGSDFSGADLTGADFRGAMLPSLGVCNPTFEAETMYSAVKLTAAGEDGVSCRIYMTRLQAERLRDMLTEVLGK